MAGAPPLYRVLGEVRALTELLRFMISKRALRRLPGGDRQAVIVFPGLLSSDSMTAPMRELLDNLGYYPHGWELGMNLGLKKGLLPAMEKQVRIVHEGSRRPVSLVGWSLGGLYARELAKRMPDKVRQVITIGTPLAGDPRANRAWRLYEWLSGHAVDEVPIDGDVREHPPVPTTSIYSTNEAVVAASSSIAPPTPLFESVPVSGSHIGLVWNPAVMRVLIDRLAQPEGEWQRYDPKKRAAPVPRRR